jgi:hypothetical protein
MDPSPSWKKNHPYRETTPVWPLDALSGRPQLALQALSFEPLEVDIPSGPARAPFEWSHAGLESLRELLLHAQRQGTFSPQPDLPL